jgi:hypothetical protein
MNHSSKNIIELDNCIFRAPFTCKIVGPSQSGKTTLVTEIIQNHEKLICPFIQRIVYCYSQYQPKFESIKKNVEFVQGLPDFDLFDPEVNNLLILDDLEDECVNSSDILKLFTVNSHHKNISTFFLSHNYFRAGKYSRTINLNLHYLIQFSNPADKSQLCQMGYRMYPECAQYLIECYANAIQCGHRYLFIDFRPATPDNIRCQTGILPSETRVVFCLKENF